MNVQKHMYSQSPNLRRSNPIPAIATAGDARVVENEQVYLCTDVTKRNAPLPKQPKRTHQLVPPFFPSNAACNIEIAFCTLRCLVDGLVDPPNLRLPLRSELA